MRQFAKCKHRVMNGLQESSQLLVHSVIDRFAGNLRYLRTENLKYFSIICLSTHDSEEDFSFFNCFSPYLLPFSVFPKFKMEYSGEWRCLESF